MPLHFWLASGSLVAAMVCLSLFAVSERYRWFVAAVGFICLTFALIGEWRF